MQPVGVGAPGITPVAVIQPPASTTDWTPFIIFGLAFAAVVGGAMIMKGEHPHPNPIDYDVRRAYKLRVGQVIIGPNNKEWVIDDLNKNAYKVRVLAYPMGEQYTAPRREWSVEPNKEFRVKRFGYGKPNPCVPCMMNKA